MTVAELAAALATILNRMEGVSDQQVVISGSVDGGFHKFQSLIEGAAVATTPNPDGTVTHEIILVMEAR